MGVSRWLEKGILRFGIISFRSIRGEIEIKSNRAH